MIYICEKTILSRNFIKIFMFWPWIGLRPLIRYTRKAYCWHFVGSASLNTLSTLWAQFKAVGVSLCLIVETLFATQKLGVLRSNPHLAR